MKEPPATHADRTAKPFRQRGMDRAPLIVDIGCHRGDDTAYYLAKGFRVLAIEANPALVATCRLRFEQQIASGQLELIHACMSDCRENAPFFVNANDGWSSLLEGLGNRGSGAEAIMMSTTPIDALLSGRDAPHFLKMDVEGLEARLLKAMRRLPAVPAVLALEVDFYEGDPIGDLESLGYDHFRIVRQPNLIQDPSLPDWEFTRCSSGPLYQALLEHPLGAEAAREAFADIRTQSYRWHDLYGFRSTDPA